MRIGDTKYIFFAGQRFGDWSILNKAPTWDLHSGKKYYTPYYLCKCDCGKIRKVQGYTLLTGKSKSCGCSWKRQTKENNPAWKGFCGLPGKYFYRARHGAELRGIDFDLSKKEAWDVFNAQQGTCNLSGVPISFDKSTASLDRIDSGLGYNANNIQWVHKDINRMKNEYNQGYFLQMCGSVWKKMGST